MTNIDLSKPKVPTQAPKWLDNYGKRLWPKLASYLNKNSTVLRADEYLLQQYCTAYDIYRTAYEELKKDGLQQKIFKSHYNPQDGSFIGKDFSGYRKNPAYQMMSDALSKLNSLGRELGLSPKARSELLGFDSKDNDKTSKTSIEDFFK